MKNINSRSQPTGNNVDGSTADPSDQITTAFDLDCIEVKNSTETPLSTKASSKKNKKMPKHRFSLPHINLSLSNYYARAKTSDQNEVSLEASQIKDNSSQISINHDINSQHTHFSFEDPLTKKMEAESATISELSSVNKARLSYEVFEEKDLFSQALQPKINTSETFLRREINCSIVV